MIFDPTPHPTSLKISKKWVSDGGGLGGVWTNNHWGMHFLDKIMILRRVKRTIQPIGVVYVNRAKRAENGGPCGVFPYIREPGLDLTTSAK